MGERLNIPEKPHITIQKVDNGYIVVFCDEDRKIENLLNNYVKSFISGLNNMDGEDWKSKIEASVKDTLKINNDPIQIFICKEWHEVLKLMKNPPFFEIGKSFEVER